MNFNLFHSLDEIASKCRVDDARVHVNNARAEFGQVECVEKIDGQPGNSRQSRATSFSRTFREEEARWAVVGESFVSGVGRGQVVYHLRHTRNTNVFSINPSRPRRVVYDDATGSREPARWRTERMLPAEFIATRRDHVANIGNESFSLPVKYGPSPRTYSLGNETEVKKSGVQRSEETRKGLGEERQKNGCIKREKFVRRIENRPRSFRETSLQEKSEFRVNYI